MMEIRIIMSVRDRELEDRIKEKIAPFCSDVLVVEEDGDAGLVISIIAIVVALPGFIVNIKEIMDWFDSKKGTTAPKSSDSNTVANEGNNSEENAFEWGLIVQGRKYNIENLTKQQRNELIEKIIKEHKDNE